MVREVLSDFVAAGPEAEIVVLVSNSCQACQNPSFREQLSSRITASRRTLVECGYRVTYSGVSVDPSEADARRVLQAMGPFDRVSIGRSWLNAAASRLPARSPLAVPRIVVFAHWVALDTATAAFARSSLIVDEVGAQNVVSDETWAPITSRLCGLGERIP
jgi:hypothetical protein